ncbi:hypothetical protein [Zavarzinia compransoris]|uniref:hypothetical protein n=1 Tax=Zavarzinia compransoris TaxID=1264899 RepID=UPI00106087BF|nr:hypothetical protein [Zavarzinia compransoris]
MIVAMLTIMSIIVLELSLSCRYGEARWSGAGRRKSKTGGGVTARSPKGRAIPRPLLPQEV